MQKCRLIQSQPVFSSSALARRSRSSIIQLKPAIPRGLYTTVGRSYVTPVGRPQRCSSRQLVTIAASHGPKASSTLSSASNIVTNLRHLAKAWPRPSDANAFDSEVDRLLSDFRSLTSDGSRATSRDLGAAVWSMGKLAMPCGYRHAPVLVRALTSPTALRDASPQTLASALYGIAHLYRNTSSRHSRGSAAAATALIEPALRLAAACLPRLALFSEQEIANLWWAVAALAKGLSRTAAVGGVDVGSHSRGYAATAVAAAGVPEAAAVGAPALWGSLLAGLSAASVRGMRVGARGRGWSARGVATVLWAAQRLRYQDEELLRAAGGLLAAQLPDVATSDPRALSSCLWALAGLRYSALGPLLSAASCPAANQIRNFDDQGISNLMWAYGTTRTTSKRLCEAVAGELTRRAATMNLQSLSISLWALAGLGHRDVPLMAAVGAALTEGGEAGPQEEQTPPLKPEPQPLRGQKQQRKQRKQGEQGKQQLSMRQQRHQRQGQGGPGLAVQGRAWLAERLAESGGRQSQAVTMLAWSYASLDVVHEPLMAELLAQAAALCGQGADGASSVGDARSVVGGRTGVSAAARGAAQGHQPAVKTAERPLGGTTTAGAAAAAESPSSLPGPFPFFSGLSAAPPSAPWSRPSMPPRELVLVLYSGAKVVPHLGTAHPHILQALLAAVDQLLLLPAPGRVDSQPAGPEQPPSISSSSTLDTEGEGNSTDGDHDIYDDAAMALYDSDSSSGGGSSGARGRFSGFHPRDLNMLAWSLAVLCPGSPTLRRVLEAAVAATASPSTDIDDDAVAPTAAASAAAATPTAAGVSLFSSRPPARVDAEEESDGEGPGVGGTHNNVDEDGLGPMPYHLYGLTQLYVANYAWCLAEAARNGGAGKGGADADDCASSSSAAAVATVVRQAAAAMRCAEQGAAAIGSGGRPGSSDDDGDGNGGNVGAGQVRYLALQDMQGQGGMTAEVEGPGPDSTAAAVMFGPLATCPALFAAARDAWFINTVTTRESALHMEVVRTLQAQMQTHSACGAGAAATGTDAGKRGRGRVRPTAYQQPQGTPQQAVAAVAAEVHTPDRMQRVDVLVLYSGWLVLLQVDGPSHFGLVATEAGMTTVGDTTATGNGRVPAKDSNGNDGAGGCPPAAGPVLMPLGDTRLRDWLVAASVGVLRAAPQGVRAAGTLASASVRALPPFADPRAVEGLLAQLDLNLDRSRRQNENTDRGVVMHVGDVETPGENDGRNAKSPEGAARSYGLEGVRGVALASISFAQWQEVNEGEKWGSCLRPLLDRVCGF